MRAHRESPPHDLADASAALRSCARGELPPNVALTHLFMAARDPAAARRALDSALHDCGQHDDAAAERLRHARDLWESTPDAFDLVKAIVQTLAHDGAAVEKERAVEHWGARFDRAAEMSAAGSVALYTLGRPDLLDAVTGEIVAFMRACRLLDPDSVTLEIGCGNGRVLRAVAPHVRAAVGVDVSARMLSAARGRTGRFMLVRSSGRDLASFAGGAFDGVYAVDVFPYLVQSGLAENHLSEIGRVLRPEGWLLILNYSYRNDIAADRAEVARYAAANSFAVCRNGTREFSLWDGTCFLLDKAVRSGH
jgi:SAM-dependent methyltransferase